MYIDTYIYIHTYIPIYMYILAIIYTFCTKMRATRRDVYRKHVISCKREIRHCLRISRNNANIYATWTYNNVILT